MVVSSRLKKSLPANLDPAKVRVIPCGIDLERFRPMDKSCRQRLLGWNASRFHVLFVSNTGDPVKRPELARDAVEALKSSRVPAELHVLQGVANAEVPVWMNAGDALVLTSLHEGSPTVVKEALACGLPVVSVDVGDVVERFKGIDGCHLSAPNPGDLAAKLTLVRQAGVRLNAREQVQELSLRNVACRLESFYRDTLALSGQAKASRRLAASLQAQC